VKDADEDQGSDRLMLFEKIVWRSVWGRHRTKSYRRLAFVENHT